MNGWPYCRALHRLQISTLAKGEYKRGYVCDEVNRFLFFKIFLKYLFFFFQCSKHSSAFNELRFNCFYCTYDICRSCARKVVLETELSVPPGGAGGAFFFSQKLVFIFDIISHEIIPFRWQSSAR